MKIHVNFRHPLNNLCYVLSEALYHNWGKENGLRPYHAKIKDCPGVRGGIISHWWLQDESGKVYDLTAGQFDVDFPYELGKPCGVSHAGAVKTLPRTNDSPGRSTEVSIIFQWLSQQRQEETWDRDREIGWHAAQ